jgi:hypothetical protein
VDYLNGYIGSGVNVSAATVTNSIIASVGSQPGETAKPVKLQNT